MRNNGGQLSVFALAAVCACMLLAAIATNLIGIFAIFGAFLLGAVLSSEHDFRREFNARVRDLATAFFLPIFFMNTGLRTELGRLHSVEMWLICLAVVGVSVFGKFAGCSLAARLGGFSAREAGVIGALMNTRGLMELIVVNVGYEMGVIPGSVYCMLVVMALVTTMMTTPLVMHLMKGTELEPYIRESEFAVKPHST